MEAEIVVSSSLQVQGPASLVGGSQELLYVAKLQSAAAADTGQTGQECVLASLGVTLCHPCAPQADPAVSCDQATKQSTVKRFWGLGALQSVQAAAAAEASSHSGEAHAWQPGKEFLSLAGDCNQQSWGQAEGRQQLEEADEPDHFPGFCHLAWIRSATSGQR